MSRERGSEGGFRGEVAGESRFLDAAWAAFAFVFEDNGGKYGLEVAVQHWPFDNGAKFFEGRSPEWALETTIRFLHAELGQRALTPDSAVPTPEPTEERA